MSLLNLARLLSLSHAAVEAAGDIIRRLCGSQLLNPVYKGEKDPVTDADIQSQRLITGTLRRTWPQLSIIGEETVADTETPLTSDRVVVDDAIIPGALQELAMNDVVVWVDPLDGTMELLDNNLEAITVLVGIAYRGKPVAGVVHQPFFGSSGRTIWGVVGAGVFGARTTGLAGAAAAASAAAAVGEPVGLISAGSHPTGPSVCTTRTHGSALIEKSLELLKPSKIVRIGGAGYKVRRARLLSCL